jgi:hypothetical protein
MGSAVNRVVAASRLENRYTADSAADRVGRLDYLQLNIELSATS